MAEEIKTKKMTDREMVEELRKLNSSNKVDFYVFGKDVVEFCGIHPRDAKFPEGYYYTPISGISNRKYAKSEEDVASFRILVN